MDWYEKLNQYFPIEEMKSKQHLDILLKEKSEIYHKDEGPHHVLMYVETNDFVFVDYLFVSKEARGQGLGKKLLNKLKDKDKPIILEVEPVDYEDTDTQKRQKFYNREGFQHAKSIGYKRRSLATNEINELEILYWAPNDETEETIFEQMKHTYEHVHTYKDVEIYGTAYQPTDEVLSYNEEEAAKSDPLQPS
ncbi:GNAT family N-acetyltransferase [Alkalihalobacillus pseudalcaliphilus]|uniref:GNAT family N-acetyltransferase n=1 Tax=Alkalihalobacillus pseudalcaliphilus TaxID=79884 RepID=UPI00064DEDD9|nr:GNAT family N-acetyltransferase [Alkalihalobacillus pseudalcaliphilus]KMK74798.1 acetyltransferase [Alkalihalobacillus pseudalcaliphilus]